MEEESENYLQLADWIVIGLMLAISSAVGIFYGYGGKNKQKTSEEYFSADRSTGPLFLSVAIMVAFLSGISLLGSAGENYSFGVQLNLIYIFGMIGTPIVCYFYLPVFYELRLMSVFEYLERRFSAKLRIIASLMNFMQYTSFTGVVLYAPALTLEATTGLDGTFSILLIGVICTFYSTIGGIKAVIITDLLQGFLMFLCIVVIIMVAISDIDGGIWTVIKLAYEGGRLNLIDLQIDLTLRHSFLACSIGGVFFFLAQYAVNQSQVQRMLTAGSLKKAQRGLYWNVPFLLTLTTITSFSGLAIYAYYIDCDPVSAGKIKSYDMIMAFFAKERLTKIPGLTGIFVAGIFSASLSTVSAQLNSLSAVALSDYLKPLCQKFGHEIPDSKLVTYGKILALLIGMVTLVMAFLAAHVKRLLQTIASIHGAIGGPSLGLFTLGMFFESANETGAIIGTLIALIFNLWVAFSPKPYAPILPMSIEGCPNSTIIPQKIITSPVIDDHPTIWITQLSYILYVPLGFLMTITIGLFVSIIVNKISKQPQKDLEPNLFTPFVATRIRRRRQQHKKKVQNTSQVDRQVQESHDLATIPTG